MAEKPEERATIKMYTNCYEVIIPYSWEKWLDSPWRTTLTFWGAKRVARRLTRKVRRRRAHLAKVQKKAELWNS